MARVALREPEPELAPSSLELTQHLVTIQRPNDPMTRIPTTVFDHELPILFQIYGQDGIVVVESKIIEVANFDIEEEYARLGRKYEPKDNDNALEKVYGLDARTLAKELGLPYDSSFAAKRTREKVANVYTVGAGN